MGDIITSPTARFVLRPVGLTVFAPLRGVEHLLDNTPLHSFIDDGYDERSTNRFDARQKRRAEMRDLRRRQRQATTIPEWSQRVRERVRGSSVRRLKNIASCSVGVADILSVGLTMVGTMGPAVITSSILATFTAPWLLTGLGVEGISRTSAGVRRFKARAAATKHLH